MVQERSSFLPFSALSPLVTARSPGLELGFRHLGPFLPTQESKESKRKEIAQTIKMNRALNDSPASSPTVHQIQNHLLPGSQCSGYHLAFVLDLKILNQWSHLGGSQRLIPQERSRLLLLSLSGPSSDATNLM